MEAKHDPLDGPLVSVILPVYNRAGWVARSIESVFAQTYQRFELLVIDDGSTDDTGKVLQRFASRLKILKQPNAGVAAARNAGLKAAQGEFVAFIDSDDIWYPDRLQSQLPLFDRAEVGLVFGDAVLVDYRDKQPRRLKRTFFDGVRPNRGSVMQDFARGCFVPCSSVLARRVCFATGGFKSVRTCDDYLKWLEISAVWQFDYVSHPVFEYAIHPGGLTHDLIESLENRIESFSEVAAQNNEPAMDQVLRRILFNLRLSLSLARLRRGVTSLQPNRELQELDTDVKLGERLSWTLEFGVNQLRTRARWLLF